MTDSDMSILWPWPWSFISVSCRHVLLPVCNIITKFVGPYVHVQDGQKNPDCFWDQITLQRLMIETRQKFQILSRIKCIICMTVQLNILCLICINGQPPPQKKKLHCIWQWRMRFAHFYAKYSKTRTISITHVVSPDEIQHVRSKSECLPSECWNEENISRKALDLWFLSLFQNSVRRTLCLCSQVLKQTVFITVRTYWNKVYCSQFAVSRTTTSCSSRTERHACHSPHCRLAYICIPMCLSSLNQKKWPPNSLDLNPADYSVWTTL